MSCKSLIYSNLDMGHYLKRYCPINRCDTKRARFMNKSLFSVKRDIILKDIVPKIGGV